MKQAADKKEKNQSRHDNCSKSGQEQQIPAIVGSQQQ
jgi:hypothetical protein